MKRRPTGTPIAAALKRAPEPQTLPLSEDVPCPGRRYGKGGIVRATLLTMRGDASFVFDDNSLVYQEAKKLGIEITTRREPNGKCRVWRLR